MMVNLLYLFVVAVQSLSCVQLFVTPRTAAHQAPLSFTISWSLLKFMSIELVMPSNHLILCRPFLLLPSIVPASGGQSIGASASASVLPMNIQGWFPFRWGVLMSFSLMMNVWWMFLLQNTEKQKELERRRIPPTLRKTLVTIWGFSPSSFFIRYFFNTPFWNLECFTQKQPVY